jgi:hypothetical protein
MTKEERVEAINRSWEAMMFARFLKDEAATVRERGIAEAIYEAHNAIYWILCEDHKRK